jgi:3-oxoacyl-[acyl-carrier-protein] synthase II
MTHRNRVVVTGMGVVAPNGVGMDAFWNSLMRGESGIDTITRFDTTDYPIRIAGEIRDFDLADFVDNSFKSRRLARQTQYALAAAVMAMQEARLDAATLASNAPVSIVVGVGSGAVDIIESAKERLLAHGPGKVSPFWVAACQPHAVASALAVLLKTEVRAFTVSSACVAGVDAVAHASDLIRRGEVDLVLAGGADCATSPLALACFCAAGLVPSSNGREPGKVSRPFDRERKGGITAEGAGILVLERLESAMARGAVPLLEILGHGDSVDKPDSESASGLLTSMSMALENSCLRGTDIDYICAHGPSDPTIDRVETETIKTLFGDHAYRIPVTSIKGATGNPLSAAGPHQIATCAMSMRSGIIPPTTNYEYPDPACDLDYVPNSPRRAVVNHALVNLHGLGGRNSSLIVGRVGRS